MFEKTHNSPIFNCALPFLDALGWKGDDKHFYDSLPYLGTDFSVNDFVDVLTTLQFKPKFHKGRLGDLNITYPCIFFNDDLNILIYRKTDDGFLIYDGAKNKFSHEKIEEQDGVFIFVDRIEEDEFTLYDVQGAWVQELIARFKRPFLKVAGLSFILSILSLAVPLFVIVVYNQISIQNSDTSFSLLALGITLYVVALFGFTFIRSYILSTISTRVESIINRQVFKRLINLPSQATSSASIGSQMSRFKDFGTIVDFLSGRGLIALFDLPFISILLAVLFILGGTIAFIPLGTIVIFVLLALYYTPIVRKFGEQSAKIKNKKNEYLIETFTKTNSIIDFSLQNTWLKKFSLIHKEELKSGRNISIVNSSIVHISNGVISLAALLTIGLGVVKVIEREMSAGGLIAYILMLWKIFQPLKTIFSLTAQINRLKSSVVQLNKFMSLELESKFGKNDYYLRRLKGNISFSQVSVRYAQSTSPVLLGIDFDIRANETLVIVGHQNSGKSSILKMILSLHPPQTGRILIDDKNINQISPDKLRDQIAFCPREPIFFNETIMNSFLSVNPKLTEEEIWDMFSELGIKKDLESLPKKLDTVLDENIFTKLSTGVLKGLTLARAFMKDSSILVCDDLDRNLSSRNADMIKKYLSSQKGKKTMIITTDGYDFFPIADKILWLDKGRVKMFGPKNKIEKLYYQKAGIKKVENRL